MTCIRWAKHDNGQITQFEMRDADQPFPPGWQAYAPGCMPRHVPIEITGVAETATVEAPRRRGRPPGSKNRARQ